MTKTIFAFWDEVRELIFYLPWDSVTELKGTEVLNVLGNNYKLEIMLKNMHTHMIFFFKTYLGAIWT